MVSEIRPLKFKSHQALQKMTRDYWDKAAQAKSNGQLVAYCSALTPTDILSAMGFFLVFIMNNAATCGAHKVSTALCEDCESQGFSPDLCSYARTDIGMALNLTQGKATDLPIKPPKPDLILIGNGQCHSILKWGESLGQIYNVPVFSIDVPMMHDGASAETYSRAHRYVVSQLTELISFVENFTGRPFNYDRLQQCVEYTGSMFRTLSELLRLRQNRPSPMSCFDVFTNLFPILGCRATPEGAAYYRQLKAEILERIAKGIGAIPDEQFRIHLDGVPLWFNLSWLFNEFAAKGVCPITHPYPLIFNMDGLDSSRPLESIADCFLHSHLNVGIKQRIQNISRLAQFYQLDGLAMQMSRTCKALSIGIYDIAEGVEQETGLPTFVYETDMCDSRLHSNSQVATALQAFVGMLEEKKSRTRG